eukprot:CAMPEP_0201573226 /NCGR_PEP_ID=MMETSP0190_2-20130828/16960_1 /ASSEMBLY_ACC=CAM_ASM_000263 /TAXON_ID=37353 /ORGANISM="Rosalina sp." /LENGTH=44 /DNA_ID= /DNA_START= /DNA_END= /DNA_ORIENTATION=
MSTDIVDIVDTMNDIFDYPIENTNVYCMDTIAIEVVLVLTLVLV